MPACPAGTCTCRSTDAALTAAQLNNNPFLVRSPRAFVTSACIAGVPTRTSQSFYIQDDCKINQNIQFNVGLRWDYQQAYGSGRSAYLKLNNFWTTFSRASASSGISPVRAKASSLPTMPRYLETPIPLDINVRAGSDTSRPTRTSTLIDLNAPAGSIMCVADVGNLGATPHADRSGSQTADVNEVHRRFRI